MKIKRKQPKALTYEVKAIEELPENVSKLVYFLRLACYMTLNLRNFMYFYTFIVIDNVIYCKNKNSRRVKQYLKSGYSGIAPLSLPDFVMYKDEVKKNRYGSTSTHVATV